MEEKNYHLQEALQSEVDRNCQYTRKIKELERQANLVAVNEQNAVQIGANGINETLNQSGNAIVKLRAAKVEEELWNLMYGTIRKGDMTIDELYRRILQIGRQANYKSEELRRKFIDAFSLLWLEKAKDIGEHLPLNELAKKLYKIELSLQPQEISLEDMQKAIQNILTQQKTEYQSLLEKQKTDFQSQMEDLIRVMAKLYGSSPKLPKSKKLQ
ncbi:hypothetical protein C1645_830972 [Glomus cerebriforme]|uniref:Uncharacterized protein n=1 Tax=Glomus cerebriforme TaxID=658196 RepID=A0A397SGK7_9GLOM|nr:hypothetical protein C1645_830972 [Glomus cerebriforme]